MQAIFELIEGRRRAYEQHPFIRFLRDDSIPSERRLAYAPYGSHFVLTFSEFNRTFLQGKDSPGPRQDMVNRHADEDATHFAWFLHDLKVLGYDIDCRFTDVLRFLWSDDGTHGRAYGHYIISVTRDASPEMRLVIIEAVEALGNVWLTATVQAALGHPNYDRLVYFAQHHLDRETGHAIGSSKDEILSIVLPDELRARARTIVDGIFDHTAAFSAELLERTLEAEKTPTAAFLEH